MKSADARRVTIQILDRVFQGAGYADIVLDDVLQRRKLDPRDSALVTELVYGTLRWFLRLERILQRVYAGKWDGMPRKVRYNLAIALYQHLFLDKVPDYALVHEAVKIAKPYGSKWAKVTNAVLREIIRNPSLAEPPSLLNNPARAIAVTWSHPEWLVRRWIQQFGIKRTESICRANNERPPLSLRVNVFRSTREEVQVMLRHEGIVTGPSDLLPEFLTAEKTGAFRSSDVFQKGAVYVQDVSAGLVAHLMDPKPGERILDVAAAPGGKTTHMSELSRAEAFIIAGDVSPDRIRKVVENRDRLGLKNITPLVTDGRELGVRCFDKVLLDAPCSGLGVMRRRGEMRWQKKEEDISKLVSIQKALLTSAAGHVRAGGSLVYSTCTVLPEENEGILNDFLSHHTGFRIENAQDFVNAGVVNERGCIETWPDIHGTDGTFAVRLKRKE